METSHNKFPVCPIIPKIKSIPKTKQNIHESYPTQLPARALRTSVLEKKIRPSMLNSEIPNLQSSL